VSEPGWENVAWLTINEVAAQLRVSAKMLYKLVERDRSFPAIRVGGLLRIRRERLERWLERQHPSRKPLRSSPDAVGKTDGTSDAAKAPR
jgi:excisionase family DNA binding protein